jgi:hypothetical protein
MEGGAEVTDEQVNTFLGLIFDNKMIRGYAAGIGCPVSLEDGDYGYYAMADFLESMAKTIREAREPTGVPKK